MNFQDLFDKFEINREILDSNIKTFLENQDQTILEEIILNYAITQGIAEIAAYLSVALSSMKHIIDSNVLVHIQWIEKDAEKFI